MEKKENSTAMARVLKFKPATINRVKKYLGKAVDAITTTTIKTAMIGKLPLHEAKVRTMYDYGNCLA